MTAASAAAMAVQSCEPVVAPGRYQFHLPVRTDEDLRLFVAVAFGIVVPDVQVCPDHSTPWRALCDAFFSRHQVMVWEASRGFGGKSQTLALLGLLLGILRAADTNLLGGSGEQAERVLEHMGTLMTRRNAPRHALVGEVAREMRLTSGAKVRTLMASPRSVRGPHPVALLIDEVDEAELPIVDAALGQPMSNGENRSVVVLSSTHHNPDGTMTEIKRRAAAKGWPVHRWCLEETRESNGGWLKESDIEAARNRMSAAMWRNEILLQEPAPEGRAIDTAAVERMFRRDLGEFRGAPGERVRIAIAGAGGHGTGADWARKVDDTVVLTLAEVDGKAHVVAYERMSKLPWPNMIERFDSQVREYGDCPAAHDATGLGDVVDAYIEADAEAVNFSGAGSLRRGIINGVIRAIESGEIVSPMIATLYQDCKYATNDDLWGNGHLPDGLCALALAYRALQFGASTEGTY